MFFKRAFPWGPPRAVSSSATLQRRWDKVSTQKYLNLRERIVKFPLIYTCNSIFFVLSLNYIYLGGFVIWKKKNKKELKLYQEMVKI